MHRMKLKLESAFLSTASWRISILLGLACVTLGGHAASEELPRFGKLPDLGREWKVRESDTNGTAAHGFSWMVFANAKTGDLMSFAAHKYGDGARPKISRLTTSSTAGEIFPAGYPAWTAGHPRVRVNWLRNDVGEVTGYDWVLGKPLPKEALQYSIVFEDEAKPGTNRLAHGSPSPWASSLSSCRTLPPNPSPPTTPKVSRASSSRSLPSRERRINPAWGSESPCIG